MVQKFKIQRIEVPIPYEKKCAYDRFIVDIAPVQSATVYFRLPLVCLSDTIKGKLDAYDNYLDVLKTKDDLFFSSYRYQEGHTREEIERDDGYTGGSLYIHKPTIQGAVVSEQGDFMIYPDKEYHYIGSHKDTEFDGTCGIYNPMEYYYAKNIQITYRDEKKTTSSPAKTLREFAKQNFYEYSSSGLNQVLKKLAQEPTYLRYYNSDFQSYYQTETGENVYIAELPIQQFNNGLTLFTAYTVYHTDKVEERNLHFFIPKTKTHITLSKIKEDEKRSASLTIDGKSIPDFPYVTDLSMARKKALDIPSAGRFSEILDTYIFSDKKKQLLTQINQLDSYDFIDGTFIQNSATKEPVKITRNTQRRSSTSDGRVRE